MVTNIEFFFTDSDADVFEVTDEYDIPLEVHDDDKENVADNFNEGPANKKRRTGTPWRTLVDSSEKPMPQWKSELPTATEVRSPSDYFRDFFDDEILSHIVEQSNLYAIQTDPNNPININKDDLEQFIASLFMMSMIKITNTRLYWSCDFDYDGVSKMFSRNRWELIKKFLHCNNNDDRVPRDNPNFDILFKVRPVLTHLQNKFRNIPKPQMLSVDEQLVPFKGRSQIKQYMPNKPHKRGFKVFALCDDSGILHDFEVYTGKIHPVEGEPDLGASSNVVLKMSKTIPHGKNHLLYFDNWFTSIPLATHLASKEIYCLGTVRMNRVPGVQSCMTADKELLKRGRGSHCEITSVIDNTEVRVVKWADNKCVSLLSTFSSAGPIRECNRFDRKKKEQVKIPCPQIVQTYNKFMGGVDLMDSLIGLYRIKVRSKKSYHKLLYHFLDVSVVNAWLLYRRDCDSLDVPLNERHDLQHFKLSVAKSLAMGNKSLCNTPKVGRPSQTTKQLHSNKKMHGNRTAPIPSNDVRKDGYHHWPDLRETQNRCKMPGCGLKTYNVCTKCLVYLCYTKGRNCFSKFHS